MMNIFLCTWACDTLFSFQVQFHLKQLERQIVPTDTTKMSLWTLEQDESFYKDRKRGSLFNILRNELGCAVIQIARTASPALAL